MASVCSVKKKLITRRSCSCSLPFSLNQPPTRSEVNIYNDTDRGSNAQVGFQPTARSTLLVVFPPLALSPLTHHSLTLCHRTSVHGKNLTAVLEHELYSQVLRMHIRHFPLKAVVAHDSRCEYHRQVLRGHLWHLSVTANTQNRKIHYVPSSPAPD